MRLVRFFLALVLLLAAVSGAGAEGDLTLDFSLQNGLYRTRALEMSSLGQVTGIGERYWAYGTSGSAGFSFEARGNRNVKADFGFSFVYPEQDISALTGREGSMLTLITIDRAYVKARFPLFRLTLGKNRLSWGEGFVFNAGDVIFGSTGTQVDLTAKEVRTETKWLASVNVPLGRFTFLEALAVPPPADSTNGKPVGDVRDSSAGGRFYTKLGQTKVEGGYFYKGDENLHRPYLSLQGHLLADWSLSVSADGEQGGGFVSSLQDSLKISAGLFHLQKLNRVQSLSFRLESLIRPQGQWAEGEPETEEGLPVYPEYGLYLYPEISFAPSETVNLSLRSLVSPLDRSAQITLGGSWNVMQGYTLSAYLITQAGDDDDLFPWEKKESLWVPGQDYLDGAAFILGVNYIY